jgi:hypothetical protein
MALFSTASEFHAGAPLEGGWQLSDGFSSLACALSWPMPIRSTLVSPLLQA